MKKLVAMLTIAFAMLSAHPASAADPAYEWATANGATFVEEATSAASAAARGAVPSLPGWLVLSSGYAYATSASEAVEYLGPAPGSTAKVAAVVFNDGTNWRAGYVIIDRVPPTVTVPAVEQTTTTTVAVVVETTPATTAPKPATTATTAGGGASPVQSGGAGAAITGSVSAVVVVPGSTEPAPTSPTKIESSTSMATTSTIEPADEPTTTTMVESQRSVGPTNTIGLADSSLTNESDTSTRIPGREILLIAGGVFFGAALSTARRKK